MKKYLITLLAILILFVGCENGLRTGTLTINVDQATAKTVMPDTTKTAIVKYVIQGFCGSNTFKQEFSSSSFSLTLEEGQWSINVDAYSSDDKLVAKSDSKTVQIVRYKDVSITFLLKPIFDGTGTFSFKLGIPHDATAMNKVLCSLTSEDGTLAEVDFEFDFSTEGTVDGDYKIFTKALTIPAGSYNLKVETTNLLGAVYGIPINDSVIIQAEQETNFEHIWDLAFFPEEEVTLTGWKYYAGSMYVFSGLNEAVLYMAVGDGSFSDVTADVDSNKYYSTDEETFENCRFYASLDASKWTRGGEVKDYSSFSFGPTGGYVFYDKGSYSDGWRFLEVAKIVGWNHCFGYSRPSSSSSYNIQIGTETDIGKGKANTITLINKMRSSVYEYESGEGTTDSYAANYCYNYSVTVDGVVYDDWFLPSIDELDLIYKNLHCKGVRSFANKSYYWSSSEVNSNYAWTLYSYNGNKVSTAKSSTIVGICPIRYF